MELGRGIPPRSAYTVWAMPAPSPVTVLEATFVAEARDVAHLPAGGLPEVAVAGRSNVGKSTLLNRMAQRHGLARVSKTPGRTRGLVVFDLEIRWPGREPERQRLRLVDLPGYGYAQVSHRERHAWQELVEGYIGRQEPLRLVLLLVDARRGLGAEEQQLMAWLAGKNLPCHLVVTKADKLGAAERGSLRERLRKQAAAGGTRVSLVSGATGEGVDELWARIGGCLQVNAA
jgi:GTP-binding protein